MGGAGTSTSDDTGAGNGTAGTSSSGAARSTSGGTSGSTTTASGGTSGTTTTTTTAPLPTGTTTSTAPPPPGGDPPPGNGSAGCGHAPATTGFTPGKTIQSGGQNRTYDLFVPPGADGTTPLALVFVLHADLSVSLRPYFPIESASAGKAIVVYPYGLDGWDLSAPDDNVDYPFLQALKDSLLASSCVAKDRVFAFGYSQGGFLANMIGCYRGSSFFRAISVNSAGLYAPAGVTAQYDDQGNLVCPASPPGALVIHGMNDTQVSYQDDGIYTRNTWRAMNQCDDGTSPLAPSPCVTYASCKSPVSFCGISGMGHTIWSNAATASWNFFSMF